MKRFSVLALFLLLAIAATFFIEKSDILLAIAKYQTSQKYSRIAPTRKIPWQHGPAAPAQPLNERAPNIILIVADDLGINDISTFGGGVSGMQTPGIDRLAAEGAVFAQSYSGASSCAPSRAMLMTGRYPTRTGFEFTPMPDGMAGMVTAISASMDNGLPPAIYDEAKEASQPPYFEKGLPASELTIAEILKSEGYYTAHIGKWHLGIENGMAPQNQGFDDSLLMSGGLYLPEDDPEVVNAKLSFDPIDKFLWAGTGFAATYNSVDMDEDLFRPGGYLTDYWTEEAISVIRANKNRSFFLYLAHFGPHTPLQATSEDYEALEGIEPHRKRVYAGMVRALDRSVMRILDVLETEGIADNTIVVFTSDNGGAGYIGLPDVNSPYRGWKGIMFEGGIRVPLLVKWPAKITAGTVSNKPVAHIDVMPTLAAAAGLAAPDSIEIDGVDLLPLVTGEAEDDWNRDTLFWQSGHYQVVRHGNWKLQINDSPDEGPREWLYNLADDPTEQRNLATSRPDKLEELNLLLSEHQANSRGPMYESSVQMPVMVDKTLAEPFVQGDEYVYTPN